MQQNRGNTDHRTSASRASPHHRHFEHHLRQDFDDDLDVNASRSSSAGSTRTQSPQKDFRILRCFCGCSQLTYEQIESYALMNVNGIIHNAEANKLLKTFLQIGHRSDKSNALLLLECYELCERIANDLDTYRDHLDDLFELCPSFLWEQKINDACDANDDEVHQRLNEILTALMKECVGNIECDHDFKRFQDELLRKIGK